MKIQNKTFIVTGAGGGIGGELAVGIIERGGTVVAVDVNATGMEQIKAKSGDQGKNMHLFTVNLSVLEEINALASQLETQSLQVDGIINCAGIIQPFKKIDELDYEAIHLVMGVNFYGTLYMTKTFLPNLLSRQEGHIINVSSMGGFLPVPGQAIYGASKAAVKLFTEGLYAELLDTNIQVSIVFPGATRTNITQNSHVSTPAVGTESPSIPMLDPSEAARIILNGIEQNKLYIYTGKDSKIMNILYRLNPKFATRFIAKKMASLLK